MRFLAIICLLFMYVESAYAKDVKQQASPNTETNVQAEVDVKEDPLRDVKDLLRVDALGDIPGEYKIIARNLNPVIKPGGAMSIEIYITGYGQIEQNKIAIYESENIIDCGEKEKPKSEKEEPEYYGVPEFLSMYPSSEKKEKPEYNVDSEKKEKPKYKSYALYQYNSGETKDRFLGLGIVRSMPGYYFNPDKKRLNEIKEDTRFQDEIKKNVFKVAPRMYSELCIDEIAPVRLNLETKKDVRPGTYSIDIYFTYFNGKEWRIAEKQVSFKVQNVFERNELWIQIFGFIASFAALFLLIEYMIRIRKWLVQHYQKKRKAPLEK